jgi:hypothetical protein
VLRKADAPGALRVRYELDGRPQLAAEPAQPPASRARLEPTRLTPTHRQGAHYLCASLLS